MALIETLQDDFEFGGLDSGKWTNNNPGQVVVGTNLDLELTSSLAGNYISITSLATYNLTGSSIFVQLKNAGNQSITSWEVYPLYLYADSNNKIFIRVAGNSVQAIKVVAGVTSNVGSSATYNATTMQWFRIREASGTTYFEYAASPTGSWTTLASVADPITITALTVEVLCGTWQAESAITTGILDNVNVTPGQFQFSWKGYTWNKRIHAGDPANNQTWSASNVSGPDTNNYITLALTNPGSAPVGCEIFSAKRGFGYGTYTIVTGTRLDNIGAPVGFGGMFTFDFTAYPDYREIDCDETRNYNGLTNKQILKNHAYNSGGTRQFVTNNADMPADVLQTHRMIWQPGLITFDSYIGTGTSGTNYFHAVHNTNIPTPGLERVHFNVFVDPTITGYATASPLNVVIQDFSFIPQPPISVDGTPVTTLTQSDQGFPFTVGNNQDRLLVVSIASFKSAISAVTYAGLPLTRVNFADSGSSGANRAELWYLIAPPVGTATLQITPASSVFVMSTATSLYGANQVSQPHTSTAATGSTNQISDTLTTTIPNTLFIDAIAASAFPTKGGMQTLLGQLNGQNQFAAQHEGASSQALNTAGTATMLWTLSTAAEWESVVAAFAPAPAHTSQTFTAKASVRNLTKSFTAKAHAKVPTPQTFTARAWVRKNVAGPLANLQFRSVDMMKWTKDTMASQPTDTTLANLVSVVQKNFNLTHIGCTLNIDPTSFYPTSFVPAPRSVAGFYQAVTSAIHNVGLRVLHRPASFAMEGDYANQENWKVGSNRYYAGLKAEIIPTSFTDSFTRSTIYTSATQGASSYSDNFNRASLGTTDWTALGNWSILNNELVCTGVANATANVLMSTATYTDFTYQAKVKKVSTGGFSGVVFRMSRDTNNAARAFANYFSGYVLELRDTNVLRIENIATSNLIQVTKTWAAGTYYQVKVVCTGSHIQAKVWQDGTAEPGSWDIDFTDTTYSAGSVGFCPENTGATAVFDDVFVSFTPTISVVTDWNTTGAWSVVNNEVKCTNAAAQYNNVMYSVATYKDFTYQAKVKAITDATGITALVFRLTTSNVFPGFSGYTLRIKDNNTLQIEDLSIATLASVAKVFTPGTYYQLKVTCSGSSIQAKAWQDGTSEPGSWDLTLTNTKYASGSVGFAPENVSAAYFDDVSVSVTTNYNSWLGIVYQFITSNPGLFQNGDIWAPFPERTSGIFSDSTAFLPNTAPGVQANYAQFFNDLKDVSDYAFAQIGKSGVLTGYTGNNFSEVRSGWIPQSLFDKAKLASWDYYQNYNQNNDFRGATAKADLDAAYSLRGNYPVVWQEWGPTPDMLANISSTAGQTINGYGNVLSPNANYAQNREAYIRDFYTNCLLAAYTTGQLQMFNYWGFWDSGDNDTGLATISGSTDTITNIKIRREGWILAEQLNAGTSPQKFLTARARTKKTSSQTFTAQAHAIKGGKPSFSARAKVVNPKSTDRTAWADVADNATAWTPVIH